MNQTLQNSYLQRYEQRQHSKESRSLQKSVVKTPAVQAELTDPNTIASVVTKLQERVDGIDVKLTSLVNVVKLLQKYTQTRDDQYEKEKENEFFKKVGDTQCGRHCSLVEMRLKEFESMSKQFKEEIKSLERIRSNLVLSEMHHNLNPMVQKWQSPDLQVMEERLRDQINKKMQICVKLINSSVGGSMGQVQKGLAEKVHELSFNLNQLENQCRRNRMILDKDIDKLTNLIKDSSTALPNHSRVTEGEISSKSPGRRMLTNNKSKNSRSDKSLSRGKQNKSAVLNIPKQHGSKVREEEMKEALRKKREHRQRLKVRNF